MWISKKTKREKALKLWKILIKILLFYCYVLVKYLNLCFLFIPCSFGHVVHCLLAPSQTKRIISVQTLIQTKLTNLSLSYLAFNADFSQIENSCQTFLSPTIFPWWNIHLMNNDYSSLREKYVSLHLFKH